MVDAESTRGISGTTTSTVVPRRKRIVVGISGATGAILGIKLLIALRRLNVETHLVVSHWVGLVFSGRIPSSPKEGCFDTMGEFPSAARDSWKGILVLTS